MSILERLLSQNGRTARMNGHDGGHDAENGAQEPKMDMLPLSAATDGHCEKYLVLVSLTGAALDNQLMAVACSVAKTKPNVEVRAIYGIEVPRTLPVNAEMPEKTRLAEEALKNAAAVAASTTSPSGRMCCSRAIWGRASSMPAAPMGAPWSSSACPTSWT